MGNQILRKVQKLSRTLKVLRVIVRLSVKGFLSGEQRGNGVNEMAGSAREGRSMMTVGRV